MTVRQLIVKLLERNMQQEVVVMLGVDTTGHGAISGVVGDGELVFITTDHDIDFMD